MKKKIQVLYAEDNPQDADMTRNHFQTEAPDFELEIAGTGKDCLERLKATEYDALLLDYRLPDMDGTDVLKAVLLQGFTLPVVMVTGVGDEALVVKALRLGASDYVPKRPNYLLALPGILRSITSEYRRKKKAGTPLTPGLKRILYVEHTQMDIELTVRHFAETAPHIQVEPVRSGREALQFLTQTPEGSEAKPCDLVMADLRGSDMNALDLCREVKHRGIQVPLIIITGKGDEQAAVAALQLGAYDYIVKRENYLTELPYAVENAIARFRLDQANVKLHAELEELNRSLDEKVMERTAELEQEIAEHKKTEEALRESEKRFRTVFERSTVGKSLTAPDGKLLRINKAFADMLGYTIEDMQQLDFAHITHPDDVAESRECIRSLVAGEQTTYQFEKRYIHKSGGIVWADLSTTLLRNGQGTPLYLISSIVDITDRKRAEAKLKQSYEQLQEALEGTINAMAATTEWRDPYTAGHQRRVTELACAIAKEMNLPEEQIRGIYMSAFIHDIGKINVPAEILSKPGRLTELEFNMIKTHPQVGYDILKGIEFPWPIASIVLQHHERLDGSGYPQGLSGEEIGMEARIMAVADVVEAMSSHRPYRPALGMEKAMEEIEMNTGILYDPEVVEACVMLFRENGFALNKGSF